MALAAELGPIGRIWTRLLPPKTDRTELPVHHGSRPINSCRGERASPEVRSGSIAKSLLLANRAIAANKSCPIRNPVLEAAFPRNAAAQHEPAAMNESAHSRWISVAIRLGMKTRRQDSRPAHSQFFVATRLTSAVITAGRLGPSTSIRDVKIIRAWLTSVS